jgi:hypothetical protein
MMLYYQRKVYSNDTDYGGIRTQNTCIFDVKYLSTEEFRVQKQCTQPPSDGHNLAVVIQI